MAPASKLLMNLGDRPLVRHVAQTAIDTGLNPDVPLVAPRHLRPLLAAFAAEPDRGICIPTYRSKRGNPVL